MRSALPLDGALSRRDRLVACGVGIGVLLLYALSFASVPTSELVAMESALFLGNVLTSVGASE